MKTNVLFLLFPFLLLSCKTQSLSGVTKRNSNDRVVLKKASGMGGSGEAFTLEVSRMGKVLFQGLTRGGLKGRHEWNCEEEIRSSLWQMIDELSVESLPDAYPPSLVDSAPTLLRFELEGEVKEVKYFANTNTKLHSLEQKLNELVRVYEE
jgi:hypothetical protein